MTAAAIAKGLGAPLHRLGRLLDLLAGEQILQRTSTPHGLSYSVIAAPALAPHGCGDWDQISRVIMADEPLEHGAYLPDYLRYVDERSSQVAPVVWDSVVPAPGRLLDLGGGLGAYSRAYVDRCPRNNATLLDLPQVIEIAASPGSRHPRIDTLACDAREMELDAQYDVVLLANLLHLYGDADCVRLLERATDALKPYGVLVIKDLYVDPDRSGPLVSLYFALNMAIYTAGGDVRPVKHLTSWCRNAGLREVVALRLAQLPEAVVVSARRH